MYILAWFDLFTVSIFAQYLPILNGKHDKTPTVSSLELTDSSPPTTSRAPSSLSSSFRVYQAVITHISKYFRFRCAEWAITADETKSRQDLLVCLRQANDLDAVLQPQRHKQASPIIAPLECEPIDPFRRNMIEHIDEYFTLQHGKCLSSADIVSNDWMQCTKFQYLCNIYSPSSRVTHSMLMSKWQFMRQSMCNMQHVSHTLIRLFMLKYATPHDQPSQPLSLPLEQGEQANSVATLTQHDEEDLQQHVSISSIVESQSDDIMKGEQADKAQASEFECFDDKYCISTMIAGGGFGTVWRIRGDDTKCVKIIELGKNESTTKQRKKMKGIVREFEFSQKAFSEHPVQCELYIDDVDICTDPKAYIILPYFQGKDLFDLIDEEEYHKVSVGRILRIFHQLLLKLDELHYNKCMLHADIKPENVMLLDADDQSDDVKVELIDYGIAKSLRNLSADDRYLEAKGHFGTKGYVAPELSNEYIYNRKTDVFSAGVVFYNLVTECVLFPKTCKYEKLSRREYDEYLSRKFRSIRHHEKVVDILYSCLAFEPEDRFTVKQLLATYFSAESEQQPLSATPSSEQTSIEILTERAGNTSLSMTETECVESVDAISSIESSSNCDFQEKEGEEIVHEETVFVAISARAWRWDSEQTTWSEHGQGTLTVYNISKPGTTPSHSSITKIVMADSKCNKVKLLQWIESQTKCELLTENENEVKWTEYDYSIDIDIPTHAIWKLTFSDSRTAQRFANVLNEQPVDHENSDIGNLANNCHGQGLEMRAAKKRQSMSIVDGQESAFSMQSSTDSSDSPSAAKCDNVIQLS